MSIAELRDKSPAELQKLLDETRIELRESIRGLHAGELANPRVIRGARRDIARIHTTINQKRRVDTQQDAETGEETK